MYCVYLYTVCVDSLFVADLFPLSLLSHRLVWLPRDASSELKDTDRMFSYFPKFEHPRIFLKIFYTKKILSIYSLVLYVLVYSFTGRASRESISIIWVKWYEYTYVILYTPLLLFSAAATTLSTTHVCWLALLLYSYLFASTLVAFMWFTKTPALVHFAL